MVLYISLEKNQTYLLVFIYYRRMTFLPLLSRWCLVITWYHDRTHIHWTKCSLKIIYIFYLLVCFQNLRHGVLESGGYYSLLLLQGTQLRRSWKIRPVNQVSKLNIYLIYNLHNLYHFYVKYFRIHRMKSRFHVHFRYSTFCWDSIVIQNYNYATL